MGSSGSSSGRRRLGRYEVVGHLADGGMAEVLLARATGIEGFARHVVLKTIRAEHASDGRYIAMFLDEARLVAALHHNNIVQVHDIGEVDGEYFIAMEYVHGRDLRELLHHLAGKDEVPPLEHVLTIATSVASALHHAHETCGPDRRPLGIVHRDVSPANILVGFEGNVKVADFGIAKAIVRRATTQVGALKGKVAYMAPEQCRGKPVDRRSDVFALGIVLFELACVRRLFKGETEYDTMQAIVSGDAPRPSQLRRDLPAAFDAICARALAVAPNDRYQTADELRLALEDLATICGLRTSTTALGDYMVAQFGQPPLPWLADTTESPSADAARGEQRAPARDRAASPLGDRDHAPAPARADGDTIVLGDSEVDRLVARTPAPTPTPLAPPPMAFDTAPGGLVHELSTVRRRPSPQWPPITPPEPSPIVELPPTVWPTSSRSDVMPIASPVGSRTRRAAIALALATATAAVAFAVVWIVGPRGSERPPTPPQPAVESTLPAADAGLAPTPAPIVAPAPVPAAIRRAPSASPPPTTSPSRITKHAEPPAPRRAAKSSESAKPATRAGKPACDPPYYFEGAKKIFKPSCV